MISIVLGSIALGLAIVCLFILISQKREFKREFKRLEGNSLNRSRYNRIIENIGSISQRTSKNTKRISILELKEKKEMYKEVDEWVDENYEYLKNKN